MRTVAFCLALLASTCWAEQLLGTVVAIADGDTVTVLDGSRAQHKVRLAGIDAPERQQAFGTRSRQRLADLVAGAEVLVEHHKRDRYGRLVGKVLVRGADVGRILVVDGLAWHYKQYEREQSAEDRVSYAEAETSARELRVGLWQDAAPVPPWEWRKAKKSGNAL